MTHPDLPTDRTEELEHLTDELRTLKVNITDMTVRSRELEADLEQEKLQEADLRREFEKTKAEISSLSLLRIGRKMAARSASEALTKQLTASMQRQVTLMQHQEDCRERLAELTARLPALEAAVRDLRGTTAAEAPSHPPSPAQEPAEALWGQLEALYPQRKVFAPHSICPGLLERLNAQAARSGAVSAAALLESRGWQLISNAEARLLKPDHPAVPGEEPEAIRPRLTRLLTRLEKHYPGRVICQSLQQQHKGLAQDAASLALYLGYPSAAGLLSAYGFTYRAASGRPATESDQVLNALAEAVAGQPLPRTVTQLIAEHPECARQIKTLQNQAPARFGCTLRQHLLQLGILAPKDDN